jgi:[ribosomal protein S5]-alanine N-acetyltransferase
MPLVAPPPIETERLWVRPATAADLPDLLLVNGDDEVTRHLPYATWRNPEDAQAWWDRTVKAEATGTTLQFVLVMKATSQVVGSCLLFRHEEASQRAELGYVMGRAHHRQGLMQEALSALIGAAFGRMGLRLIEAEVDTRNRPSGALLRRLGFRLEGVLRQRWVAKGEARDVEAYGLLRDEWPPESVRPGLRVDRLDHLVLTVRDIDAAVAFYERVMGMKAVRFGAGRTALAFGRQKINLHPAASPFAPHADQPVPGSADLCFVIETPVEQAIEHLKREGVEVIQGPVVRTGALGPIRSAYFRDLDGNLVEVSNYEAS